MSSRHLVQLGYRQLVPGEPLWARARALPEPTVDIIAWEEGEPTPHLVYGLTYGQVYHLVGRLLTFIKEEQGGARSGEATPGAHDQGVRGEP